jgi:hypothetical protein
LALSGVWVAFNPAVIKEQLAQVQALLVTQGSEIALNSTKFYKNDGTVFCIGTLNCISLGN